MSRRFRNSFKCNLEYQFGLHASYGTKFFDSVLPYPAVDFADLLICKSAIRFREWHQLVFLPHRERIISIKICAPSMTAHGIDHHRINGEWIYFPLPPIPAPTSIAINRILAFEHDTFTKEITRTTSLFAELLPAVKCNDRRYP